MALAVPLTAIDGAYLITPAMHADERGFFCETLDTDTLPELEPDFSRHCIARSDLAGTLRGLHVRAGAGEAKLVRCSAGEIFDVIVDLRPGSPTYLSRTAVPLTGAWQRSVYIPPGCAHGYLTLTDNTDVTYRIDAPYDPDAELAVAWNDPELAIRWPLRPQLMSQRDRAGMSLREALAILAGAGGG